MTSKFHLTSTGHVATCQATVRPCPLGGQHFTSSQQANDAALLRSQMEAHAQKQKANETHAAKKLTERLASISAVDTGAVKEILDNFNTSGDMLFKPGTLRLNSANYITGTFEGVEDGLLYEIHVRPGKFVMVFKSYENEDEDDLLTEARPHVRKTFKNLDLEEVYAKPHEKEWESEVVAANLFSMFEKAQDKRVNWNKDADAVSFMYFGEAFEDINRSLRNGTHFDPDFISTLDTVVGKDILTEPVTVWRGIHTKDDAMERAIMAGGYKDPGYLSTSTDEKVGRGFGGRGNRRGLLMKITLPAGTRCSKETETHEQEITLPRGYDLSNAEWTLLGDR